MAQPAYDEDLGQPLEYDPNFRGPIKNRSCTDVICFFMFFIFCGCWAGIGWYALANGDPQKLLVPRDSAGSRCGMDSHVRDRPYLFFFDLTKCLDPSVPFTGCKTEQVCVAKCPDETYIKDYTTEVDPKPYCKYDDSTTCPDWYLPSQSIQKRCFPTTSALSSLSTELKEAISKLTDSSSSSLVSDLQSSISNIKLLTQIEEVGQNVIQDILNSWWQILIGAVFALLACVIYILILRWVAAVMVWLSILGVVVALGVGIYFTTTQYILWRDTYSETVYEEEKATIKTKRDVWMAGMIILSIIDGIIILMLLFLRKRINLAIELIKEGSKAVSSVTSVLFFPIFPWLLQIGVIVYAISVGIYLACTGDPLYKTRYVSQQCSTNHPSFVDNVECDPDTFNTTDVLDCANATCKFISMQNDRFYSYTQAFNVIGFFWLAFFASAFGQMVLAQVFAKWYWTFDKSTVPFFAVTQAIYRTLRYHVGTLALGSLIITICRLIRVALEYIDRQLKKYDNALTKAIICCLKCFFWCLEKFLKFINKNAYIMCAIHGKNFCISAKDAFGLLMRNIIRVAVLDKVTDFLFFLSQLVLSFGVGAVAYVFFVTDLVSFMDNSNLNYGIVPVIIIMIITYLISALFFNVYSMAVDTLFLCFLEDCERNDGSPMKPFFMSKNLLKIFGKRNKLS